VGDPVIWAALYVLLGCIGLILLAKYEKTMEEDDVWLGLGVVFLWPFLALLVLLVGGVIVLIRIGVKLR
jgi:hypothetical protein